MPHSIRHGADSPTAENMRTLHKTITLTVLGGDPSLTDVAGVSASLGMVCGLNRRLADIRRAMIVVRTGDDTKRLHRRLTDSIIRLAGGAAADAGRLADQIVNDLRRATHAEVTHRGWTMAHIFDSPRNDPYAPRSSRLRLIDRPARRGRVGQRLRRSSDRPHRHFMHNSAAPSKANLS